MFCHLSKTRERHRQMDRRTDKPVADTRFTIVAWLKIYLHLWQTDRGQTAVRAGVLSLADLEDRVSSTALDRHVRKFYVP